MDWDEIVEDLKSRSQKMHEAREAGLAKCRVVIQASSKTIRHIHRKQYEEAARLLQEAKDLAAQARESLSNHGELYYAGYLHDAEKEMVEAAAVMAIVKDEPLPSNDELGAMVMSYLNGMGEAASECRRFALDEMRKGRMDEAERIMLRMEAVYEDLITFDFPDSMTGGLRRTCDALRAVIERTRSDLTTTAGQKELIAELKAFKVMRDERET